jgi:hypothetical protein
VRGVNQTTVYDDVTHDRLDDGLGPEALLVEQQAVARVRRASRNCRLTSAK